MLAIFLVLVFTLASIGLIAMCIRRCADSRADGEVLPLRANVSAFNRKNGLDPAVIEKFPVIIYSAVKNVKVGIGGALECAVCLCEFEDDETLRLLPKCDHVFHADCIGAWLAFHVTCPVCRAELTAGSDEGKKLNQPNESNHNSSASELGEDRNQIVIDINDQETSDGLNPARNPSPTAGNSKNLSRSHSTGHSIVQAGATDERYALRLPEEMRKQLIKSGKLRRVMSSDVVSAIGERSRNGGGGEGSSRGRNYRSERWVLSVTPPFVTRVGSVSACKVDGAGHR